MLNSSGNFDSYTQFFKKLDYNILFFQIYLAKIFRYVIIFNNAFFTLNFGGLIMKNTCSIVLAAGEGTRMKSNMPKVLSKVLFRPMLKWVLNALNHAEIATVCVVAGYKSDVVIDYLKTLSLPYETVIQTERKGTAHAVLSAKNFLLENIDKDVLILNGDAPFINSETIINAYELHRTQKNAATVISARIKNPFGYGRIIRTSHTGTLADIVEQKDADEKTQKIDEVNSGAYWFNVSSLLTVLHDIKNDNSQGEFYLPDTISLLLSRGFNVNAYISQSENTVLGANNPIQLNELNNIARINILRNLMLNGVDIPCTHGIIITDEVKIGHNTCILPGTIITGKTIIGTNCVIGPSSHIDNCLIGNNITLRSVDCTNSRIISDVLVRPFSVISNDDFV